MELSEDDKQQITKILKKAHKHAWTNSIIEKVIVIIQNIRDGTIKLNDFILQDILSYEDYLYNLNLIQYANGNFKSAKTF